MEHAGSVILGFNEFEKDGLGLKIERRAMAFEHGFFRGPSPSFASTPLGLLGDGHDTSRDPLQSRISGLHEVNPPCGSSIRPSRHDGPNGVPNDAMGNA